MSHDHQCHFELRKGVLHQSDKINHLSMKMEIFYHIKFEGEEFRGEYWALVNDKYRSDRTF